MKRVRISTRTTLEVNESAEGQRIEDTVERLLNNNEPIPADAPLIYSERLDDVEPDFDINADRHEVILDATTIIEKTEKAKRKQRGEERKKVVEKYHEGETKGQSTDGNQGNQVNN